MPVGKAMPECAADVESRCPFTVNALNVCSFERHVFGAVSHGSFRDASRSSACTWLDSGVPHGAGHLCASTACTPSSQAARESACSPAGAAPFPIQFPGNAAYAAGRARAWLSWRTGGSTSDCDDGSRRTEETFHTARIAVWMPTRPLSAGVSDGQSNANAPRSDVDDCASQTSYCVQSAVARRPLSSESSRSRCTAPGPAHAGPGSGSPRIAPVSRCHIPQGNFTTPRNPSRSH